MKVGDVVRMKWPRKDEKNSLGIVMTLKSRVLAGQAYVKVMMYYTDGKEQRWVGEYRLEKVV